MFGLLGIFISENCLVFFFLETVGCKGTTHYVFRGGVRVFNSKQLTRIKFCLHPFPPDFECYSL